MGGRPKHVLEEEVSARFFYINKKLQILLEWQDLFHTLKKSCGGGVPGEDESFLFSTF